MSPVRAIFVPFPPKCYIPTPPQILNWSQFLIIPWLPGAPPPASLSFNRLSGLAGLHWTNLLFLTLFSPPTQSPSFSTWRLQLLCGLLRFFASLPISLILSSFPFPLQSASPFPFPLLFSFPSTLLTPFPSCVRPGVSIPVHVPVPVLRSFVTCVCVCVYVYLLNCT